MNSEKSHQEAIIIDKCVNKLLFKLKLLLAYSFRKKNFIGHNLNHVHMARYFLELRIFFLLTLVKIFAFV